MSDNRERPDEAEKATSFFNRGRRYVAEIVKDNELLRSKIRRLEQALRERSAPGTVESTKGGTDER